MILPSQTGAKHPTHANSSNFNRSDCLYGCETWSLTLREEHRLRVFENRVLRGTFGPKRDEVRENGESCTMGSFIICTHHQILLSR
jgi:hypothetical protein